MRRFLFNGGVLSALFGTIGVVNATRKGPRDWRLALAWIAWAIGLATAIGTVVEDAKAEREER